MSEKTEKTYCYRHPDKETRISCNECGRYICSKCVIPAPVGQKCPECVAHHESHATKITPNEYLLSILFGGLVAVVGGYIWQMIPNGFLMALTSYLLGFMVSKSIAMIIGNKLGFKIQFIAGTLVFIAIMYNPVKMILDFMASGYAAYVIIDYLQQPVSMFISLFNEPFSVIWFFISMVIAIWASVRHFKI